MLGLFESRVRDNPAALVQGHCQVYKLILCQISGAHLNAEKPQTGRHTTVCHSTTFPADQTILIRTFTYSNLLTPSQDTLQCVCVWKMEKKRLWDTYVKDTHPLTWKENIIITLLPYTYLRYIWSFLFRFPFAFAFGMQIVFISAFTIIVLRQISLIITNTEHIPVPRFSSMRSMTPIMCP